MKKVAARLILTCIFCVSLMFGYAFSALAVRIEVEAEDADTTEAPMVIAAPADVLPYGGPKPDEPSGGQFIWAPGPFNGGHADQGLAEYTVNIPEAGQYGIWGRVIAWDGGSDSFWVTLVPPDPDENPQETQDNQFLWNVAHGNEWHWDRVNQRLEPLEKLWDLPEGQVTIKIRPREDGTMLDCFFISNELVIIDPKLEAAIREAVGKPTGDLRPQDLEPLTELYATGLRIEDLTGLEYCIILIRLDLSHNPISDITPLQSLTQLEYLYLEWTGSDCNMSPISDITPISGLTNLVELGLGGNQISDLGPLSNLINLVELELGRNGITDIASLSNLTNLEELRLGDNQMTDISPLSDLTGLRELELDDNRIVDISSLADLINLRYLGINDNNVRNIYSLRNLTQLGDGSYDVDLYLRGNNISDIRPLVENPGIDDGDTIDLRYNPLDYVSTNIYIPQLLQRGVMVRPEYDEAEWVREWLQLGPFFSIRGDEYEARLARITTDYLAGGTSGGQYISQEAEVSPSVDDMFVSGIPPSAGDTFIFAGEVYYWTSIRTWDRVEYGSFENCVIYSVLYVRSPITRNVFFRGGSSNSIIIYLNEGEVHRKIIGREMETDQFGPLASGEDDVGRPNRCEVTLQRGWNKIMLKVENGWNGDEYGHYFQICDEKLRKIPDLEYSINNPEMPSITNTTELSDTSDSLNPYIVRTEVIDDNLSEVKLFYNIDAGNFSEIFMSPEGDNVYRGEIPGQPFGLLVGYYIEASDADGNVATDPRDAPSRLYTFTIRQGWIRSWLQLGPFPGDENRTTRATTDYLAGGTNAGQSVSSEAEVFPSMGDAFISQGGSVYYWTPVQSDWDGVDYNSLWGDLERCVIYSVLYVESPIEQNVFFRGGSDDSIFIYLNGEEVHRIVTGRGMEEDQFGPNASGEDDMGRPNRCEVTLLSGWNRIMLKVENGCCEYGHYFQICDENLDEIPDLEYSINSPGKPAITSTVDLSDVSDTSDSASYIVRAKVTDDNLTGVSLFYNVDMGDFIEISMSSEGDNIYRGEIPGQLSGAVVGYYIQASDTDGNVVTDPWNYPARYHTFVIRDDVPPAAVTDLSVSAGTSESELELHWTAPGDSGYTGTANTYIVRYNTVPITESNWDESLDVDGEPTPGPADSAESMTVTMPDVGTMYYFAIKVQDEVPNTSQLSNSLCARSPIQLYTAWNLVAFMSSETMPVEDAMSSISGQYESVWTYDASKLEWLRYIVDGPDFLNNLVEMEPGWGYWIRTTEECVWDFGSSVSMLSPAFKMRKPPFTLYGKITEDGRSVTSSDRLNVSLKAGNARTGSYVLGSDPRYRDYYVLEISVDGSLHKGDIAQIYVDNVLADGDPVDLGGMGVIRRHDISYMRRPEVTKLLQNYPNPFNPETWIPYQLREDADVVIRIYAATGGLIRTLNLGYKQAGFYTDKEKAVCWDGNNEAGEHVASGVYFYSVKAGDFTATRKMVILR